MNGGVFSQTHNQMFFSDSIATNVSFYGTFNLGSNINNEFVNAFRNSEYLNNTIKDNALSKLNNKNRLGYDFKYGFLVEIPFDSLFHRENSSLVFGLSNVDHLDAAFTKDLFQFAFYGNKPFAGKDINLSESNLSIIKYQTFDVGYISYKTKNDVKLKDGVIFSIIKGQQNTSISIPNGKIFTEELGRNIDIDANYYYNSSDTSQKGIGAFNGYGVSTQFFTQIALKNKAILQFKVNDLGFIKWNKQSLELSADTSYQYSGIVVNNIFDLNDSLLNDISQDSIINTISTTNTNREYSTALPTRLTIDYIQQLNNRLKMQLGISIRALANYFPLIYSNWYYNISNSFITKAHISYGGYAKLNFGLALGLNLKNKVKTFVGTSNIESLVLPKTTFAQSAFVGLQYYF